MKIKYKVLDPSGKIINGVLNDSNEKTAIQNPARKGEKVRRNAISCGGSFLYS